MTMTNATPRNETNPRRLTQTNRLADLFKGLPEAQPIAYKFSGQCTSLASTYTDAPHATWGLSVYGVYQNGTRQNSYADALRDVLRSYATVYFMCHFTSEQQENATRNLVDAYTCGRVSISTSVPSLAVASTANYPIADFIRPTKIVWDEDVLVAEEAVGTYLKNSHADH
jgi:hypothetical protein